MDSSFFGIDGLTLATWILVLLGVLTLIVGLVALVRRVGRSSVHQEQRGGKRSRNYQAGGDLTVGDKDEGSS